MTFSLSLVDNLKQKYCQIRTNKQRDTVAKLFRTGYLRKYHLLHSARLATGMSRHSLQKPEAAEDRRHRSDRISDETKLLVSEFLLRDDNSTMKPGKKDAVTKRKCKMQKRLLCNTLFNLHLKFRSENPFVKISYSSFCKVKPF